MEILSKLPVQYLVQFKCVSKLWNTLISDPYFTKKHLNHAKNDPHSQKLLFYRRNLKDFTSSIYSCPLSSRRKLVDRVHILDYPSSSKTRIYCSYNGLVITGTFSRTDFILMMWNPSTRESILLPQPEFLLQKTNCMWGLGYDSTSSDYKSLFIRGEELPSGQILALKSGFWRNIDKHPRGINNWLGGLSSDLAVVNDAFHWICISGDYGSSSRTFYLVSFSTSNEVYTEMSLPKKILGGLERNMLVGVSVLDRMLCAYATYGHECNRTFEIWVLKDYGINESWNSLFIKHQLPSVEAIPKRFAEDEVLFWVKHIFHKMRHSVRTIRGPLGILEFVGSAIGFGNGSRKSHNRIAFTESLISPKSLI